MVKTGQFKMKRGGGRAASEGIGISTLWPQMLALAILGFAILTLSVLRFHKRLD